MTEKQLFDLMESHIDKKGLSDLLDAISQICYEKADHIQSSWQDDKGAKAWEYAGKQIDSLALKVRGKVG